MFHVTSYPATSKGKRKIGNIDNHFYPGVIFSIMDVDPASFSFFKKRIEFKRSLFMGFKIKILNLYFIHQGTNTLADYIPYDTDDY